MVKLINLGFYTINQNYLKYLYTIDSEVYYNPKYESSIKHFFGIVVLINDISYFIPITLAKEKHKKWKNVSNEHFLIYEFIAKNSTNILAVLDIKKMIPVKEKCYNKISFFEIEDMRYRNLFQKEYEFLLKRKNKIIDKVNKLYKKQKETMIINPKNCNFNKLEKAMEEWNKVCVCTTE